MEREILTFGASIGMIVGALGTLAGLPIWCNAIAGFFLAIVALSGQSRRGRGRW